MCVPGRNIPCLCGLRSTVKCDQVGADAAVVEQRVALARRSVGRPRSAVLRAQSIRNSMRSLRTCETGAAKPSWPSSVSRPAAASAASTRATVSTGRSAPSVGCDQVRSEPPWRRQLLDVDDGETGRGQHALRRQQREVGVVLVVDRVVLVALDEPQQVRDLDADRAVVGDERAQALGEVDDVGHVGEHVVRDDEVGAPRAVRRRRLRSPRPGT